MASLPLSTSAPAKPSRPKPKPRSLLRRVTTRNMRAREVRESATKNPLASQKLIANKFGCSRGTVSRYLSLPADIAVGDVTSAAKTMETFAPETDELAGVSRAELLYSTPQKHMTLSHKQKTSQEEASKAFEVLLKYCFEQPPGVIDVDEGIMLGRWMERLRT